MSTSYSVYEHLDRKVRVRVQETVRVSGVRKYRNKVLCSPVYEYRYENRYEYKCCVSVERNDSRDKYVDRKPENQIRCKYVYELRTVSTIREPELVQVGNRIRTV